MYPLHVAMPRAFDANAAHHAEFTPQEYHESAKFFIVSPSAQSGAAGKHGQRRQKRRASEAVKSVLLWHSAPKPLWLQHLWQLLPLAAAKVRHTTFLFNQDSHSSTYLVAR